MRSMAQQGGKHRPRILVIEDEQGLLEIITVNLEASGFEVLTATDGLQGWHIFEEAEPDVVVLDINLPAISGFRLLELFRSSSRPSTPVVALTALDFAEAEELAEFELDAFITKPFQLASLIQAVRDHLPPETGPWPATARKAQDVSHS